MGNAVPGNLTTPSGPIEFSGKYSYRRTRWTGKGLIKLAGGVPPVIGGGDVDAPGNGQTGGEQ